VNISQLKLRSGKFDDNDDNDDDDDDDKDNNNNNNNNTKELAIIQECREHGGPADFLCGICSTVTYHRVQNVGM
jgi:hypothetical protein